MTGLLLLVAAPAPRCYLWPSPPRSWDVQRKPQARNALFSSEYAGLDASLICAEALVLSNQECCQATSGQCSEVEQNRTGRGESGWGWGAWGMGHGQPSALAPGFEKPW